MMKGKVQGWECLQNDQQKWYLEKVSMTGAEVDAAIAKSSPTSARAQFLSSEQAIYIPPPADTLKQFAKSLGEIYDRPGIGFNGQ